MILNTPRLALRPLVSDDFEPLHVCFGDADAMRYWDTTPSSGIAQTKERLGQMLAVDPKWMASWTVVLKETVAIAGGSATTIASRGIAGSKSDSFLHLRTGVPV